MAYYRMGELYAFRRGPFKTHFITEGRYGLPPERQECDPPLLFHLGEGPGERHNVAATQPDALAWVMEAIDAHRAGMTIGDPLFDVRGP